MFVTYCFEVDMSMHVILSWRKLLLNVNYSWGHKRWPDLRVNWCPQSQLKEERIKIKEKTGNFENGADKITRSRDSKCTDELVHQWLGLDHQSRIWVSHTIMQKISFLRSSNAPDLAMWNVFDCRFLNGWGFQLYRLPSSLKTRRVSSGQVEERGRLWASPPPQNIGHPFDMICPIAIDINSGCSSLRGSMSSKCIDLSHVLQTTGQAVYSFTYISVTKEGGLRTWSRSLESFRVKG